MSNGNSSEAQVSVRLAREARRAGIWAGVFVVALVGVIAVRLWL